MPRITLLALLLIHAIYTLKRILSSFIPGRTPKPLLARRRRIPRHIAVILVSDAENHDAREEKIAMEECIEQMLDWCKLLGVPRLSVYEGDGILTENSRFASPFSKTETRDNLEEAAFLSGPLTPPPSDGDPTSRPRSPDMDISAGPCPLVTTVDIPYIMSDEGLRRRRPSLFGSKSRPEKLILHILSRESSKPGIAAAARRLAATKERKVPMSVLSGMLEGGTGFPSPDLIIVHSLHPSTSPLELHGFPPWHFRLSEIYYAPRRPRIIRPEDKFITISEIDFRRALDEYSGAQMRLGR